MQKECTLVIPLFSKSISPFLTNLTAIAAIKDESTPPDMNNPNGASPYNYSLTDFSNFCLNSDSSNFPSGITLSLYH